MNDRRKLNTQCTREHGQALVLLALMMIFFLGLVGLAIDGGLVFSERRQAQNAADGAVLSAALAEIKGRDEFSEALASVREFGYAMTAAACDPPGPDCLMGVGPRWEMTISHPPRTGEYAGQSSYIQVLITSEVRTNFAYFVYSGPVSASAESVAFVRRNKGISNNVIHALSEDACSALWFAGTSNTYVHGGDAFSNSSASDPGICESGKQNGSGNVILDPWPGAVRVAGTFLEEGPGVVSPPPLEFSLHQDIPPVPVPDCSELPDYGTVHATSDEQLALQPGRYSRITFNAGAEITLDPGMYCIYGSLGFTGDGGTITGTGVMIYLETGGFDLGGNSLVTLAAEPAPGVLVDPSRNDWKGMLLYMASGNSSVAKLTGSSDSTYSGTTYAPSSLCSIRGTGDNLSMQSQLICDTVKITGTAVLDISYRPEENYILPPRIDLAK
jgi:hypothetical protein